MRNALFLIAVASFSLSGICQSRYSDLVKQFVDYDTPVLALRHALLIDGTGGTPKPGQTVIIRKGKIDWVGADALARVPKEALILDLYGKVLMPGLIMLHEHLYNSAVAYDPTFPNLKQMPLTYPRLYLAGGATTARTCGSIEPYADLRIKKEIDSGRMPGPTFHLTAPYLEGEPGRYLQMAELKTREQAIAFVNYWADQGFTSFKSYVTIKREVLEAAIEAAHKRGLKVTGHLCSITYREAAEIGIDNIEHGFEPSTDFMIGKKADVCPAGNDRLNSLSRLNLQSDSVKALLQLLVSQKVGITSTLKVMEGATTGHRPDSVVLELLAPDTRQYYLMRVKRNTSALAPNPMDDAFPVCAKMEKLFYDAGGLLTVGTDPTGNGGIVPGYSSWQTIELLVDAAGFTPLQAIKIATLNGAIALGIEKTVGTIEAGKEADLLDVNGDPSRHISDIRKVEWVFKDGVGFNSQRLFDSVKGKVGFY